MFLKEIMFVSFISTEKLSRLFRRPLQKWTRENGWQLPEGHHPFVFPCPSASWEKQKKGFFCVIFFFVVVHRRRRVECSVLALVIECGACVSSSVWSWSTLFLNYFCCLFRPQLLSNVSFPSLKPSHDKTHTKVKSFRKYSARWKMSYQRIFTLIKVFLKNFTFFVHFTKLTENFQTWVESLKFVAINSIVTEMNSSKCIRNEQVNRSRDSD